MLKDTEKTQLIEAIIKTENSEKIEKLTNLLAYESEKTREQEALDALLNLQDEILPIIKEFTAGTDSHKYKYANLAAYLEVLKEPLRHNGFILTSSCESEKDGILHLKTTLKHRNGYSITASGFYPIDNISPSGKKNKTDIQGFGSTLSYGIRYNLIQLFTLPAEDNDGAKSRNVLIQEIHELAKQANVSISHLLDKAKSSSLEYMNHEKLQRSIDYLNAIIEKQAKQS